MCGFTANEKDAIVYDCKQGSIREIAVPDLKSPESFEGQSYTDTFIPILQREYDSEGNTVFALETQGLYDPSSSAAFVDGICNSNLPLFDNYLENAPILIFYEVRIGFVC